MKLALAALVAAVPFPAFAGNLVSGPLLGPVQHREASLWFEVKEASSVQVGYRVAGSEAAYTEVLRDRLSTSPAGTQPVTIRLPLLAADTTYEYRIAVDGVYQTFEYPLRFHTRRIWEWRESPPDFTFLFGSCAYLNDAPYDRPGKPYGKGTEIFRSMAATGASFMVWGGDNLYLREGDFTSESGIWYRYSHDRATPELQAFFASMPHYAMWDDHDYGCDDANKTFEFKQVTLDAFKAYWPNPTYGEPDNPGTYTKFTWGDAAFFLMDNRWYRDDDLLDEKTHPDKTQYGARQRDWLKQSLIAAQKTGQSTFKFIATGGQVVTDFGGKSETFAYYQNEREELLKFIADNHITGVIFLTGDVHFTELARKKIGATQWVYELTSSPLSSGVSFFAERERAVDPHRVEGTFVLDQNYAGISLSGKPGERVVTFRCYDKANHLRFEKSVGEAELR